MAKLSEGSRARINLLAMKSHNNLKEALRVARAVGDEEVTVALARAEQAVVLMRGDLRTEFEKPIPVAAEPELPPAA
jgi:hypothetical protein